MSRIFTQVDYPQFRQFIDAVSTRKIKNRGYETVIYDANGDIQAIIYAASIDEKGDCHPAQYHVKAASLACRLPLAA